MTLPWGSGRSHSEQQSKGKRSTMSKGYLTPAQKTRRRAITALGSSISMQYLLGLWTAKKKGPQPISNTQEGSAAFVIKNQLRHTNVFTGDHIQESKISCD
jgi:hypothetical protein